jgi:putative redox protein
MTKAKVTWNGKMNFLGTTDTDHQVLMDASVDVGGENSGPRPIDLFLLGLGGCTGMDIVSILRKMKVEFDDFEVDIEAQRATEHPRVYTDIEIIISITGDDIPEEKFIRAIELSQDKYCSASAMLKRTAEVRVGHRINPGRD